MIGVNNLHKTFQNNILCVDSSEIRYHYFKYHIGLKKHFLITSKIVGLCFFQDEILKNQFFERGALIFTIHFLGLEYHYHCLNRIRIIKIYCGNGDIVDYNKPLFLMEEMNG